MLMPHKENPTHPDDAVTWNKWTIQTGSFKAFVQRCEDDHRMAAQKGLFKVPPDKNSYVFVTFQDLYSQRGSAEWCDYNLQTIGFMKHVNGRYRLYPALHKSDVFIDLQFNAPINNASALDMYVKLYGFCLFYINECKDLPIHPNDVNAPKLLVVFRVNCWLQLKDLNEAQRLERILYRINYK